MSLPPEIYKYILKIRSYTAWQKRLKYLHNVLDTIEPPTYDGDRVIYSWYVSKWWYFYYQVGPDKYFDGLEFGGQPFNTLCKLIT